MLIRLGSVFFLVSVIFWLWALFDSLTSPADRVRGLPKVLWVLLVLVLFEVGALAWVIFGRPRAGRPQRGGSRGADGARSPFDGLGGIGRRGSGSVGSGWPQRRKAGQNRPPVGPDDDPDFLRGLK